MSIASVVYGLADIKEALQALRPWRIVEYKVVCAETHKDLASRTTTAIQEGWELYGSLSVTTFNTDDSWYVQAMVKREGT